MKKIVITLVLFSTISIAGQTIITKNLGDFTILKVYNGIDIELIKSDVQKLVITGKKAEKVFVKNSKNTLKIALKFPELLAKNTVKIKLYYKNPIAIIDANEGSSITSKKIEQLALEVKTQESAFINLVVAVKHLTVKSVSGGVIKLTGTSKNQTVEVGSSGVYFGFNIKAENTSIVKASLGGKAEIFVGETLDAKVSFGGSVFYKGTPEVLKTKKVLGGIIEQKN
ncbi:MAG: DUF2807 domain-containing protein [Polaribacter sp.]|nr:DUF2807 domain-containing protein [Polaribacter sp.]